MKLRLWRCEREVPVWDSVLMKTVGAPCSQYLYRQEDDPAPTCPHNAFHGSMEDHGLYAFDNFEVMA